MTTLRLPKHSTVDHLDYSPVSADEQCTLSSAADQRAVPSWPVTVANKLRMA